MKPPLRSIQVVALCQQLHVIIILLYRQLVIGTRCCYLDALYQCCCRPLSLQLQLDKYHESLHLLDFATSTHFAFIFRLLYLPSLSHHHRLSSPFHPETVQSLEYQHPMVSTYPMEATRTTTTAETTALAFPSGSWMGRNMYLSFPPYLSSSCPYLFSRQNPRMHSIIGHSHSQKICSLTITS